MERIGIYGGTFNPPHIGHIRAVTEAARSLKLDRLLLIPAGTAPHKPLPPRSPTPEQRLEMLRLAAADIPGCEVCDWEIRQAGISYTYRTLAHLKECYPNAQLVFIMGTDMFLTFPTWREPQAIAQMAELAVLRRGDSGEKKKNAEMKAQLEAENVRVTLVKNPVAEISSTQLRRLLVFGAAKPFLPERVFQYIQENGLYGVNADYRNLPMQELESVVVSLLKSKRVAHVLGCRDTAVRLARRWGADETDAARAGILHDITKALDPPLQLTLCREYGTILDTFSSQNPKTLHARTGSMVAQRVFGENQAVVDAIASHTTGKAGMNTLEKIIYVADYMEPNRDFPGVEELRELAETDLDAAMRLGLSMTLDVLRAKGQDVSPESAAALAYLEG